MESSTQKGMMPGDPSSVQEVSLYIHVPFCKRKCDYCHFYVIPDNEEHQLLWMEGFHKEWQLRLGSLEGKSITSIYFGGGTPYLLGPKRIQEVLQKIQDEAHLLPNAEITLEANPEDLTLSSLEEHARIGINRMSVGVQTFDDSLLQKISRGHTAQKAIEGVEQIFRAGISNISIDLMYDLPGQDLPTWERSLDQAFSLPISHLSLYNLTLEPHTSFYKHKEQLVQQMPNEEVSATMYELAQSKAAQAHWEQYEISAFSKKGKASQHNLGYWQGRPFLGLGPSAFSFWKGSRFRNIPRLHKYLRALSQDLLPEDFREKLSPEAARREMLIVAIRPLEGIHLPTFQAQYGLLEEETRLTLEKLVQQGLLEENSQRVRLSKKGILLYNHIASELV